MGRTTSKHGAGHAGAGDTSQSAPAPAAAAETLTAMAAASRLAAELVRMFRLMTAARHHAKGEPAAADRVVLARLVLDGPRRATDVAADTFLDLSTVSRQVRSLVDRGLVERRPDPDDRRGTLLTATEAGREAFEQYRRQRDATIAVLLREWPPEDRFQLVRLMGRLNDDMVEQHNARHCPDRADACRRSRETAR